MDDTTAQSMVANIPIHCHFAQGIGTSCYQPVQDHSQLTRLIQDALDAYNDIYPPMDLVLFEDAVRHICRITRILESGGHALLIGVGGSGRQSLASLAAYICNLHLHQPTLHQDYDLQDFKNDIAGLYLRAGVKNIGSLFLVSDAQVVDERFLVLVNDLLSSGDIADLFPEAEVENIISALRSEVKSAGIFDSRDNCWNYFINKVNRKLRVVLCFSPAGSILRSRSRKFPTLISCTCIDWFHPWPKEALVTVCNKFLEDLPILKPELRDSVADFVAFAYRSINEVSKKYVKKERRYNETTPKSFLQHVKTYKVLMQKRSNFLGANVGRLEAGLQKLVDTSEQVDVLKSQLAEQEVELQSRSVDIDALLTDVEHERERVGHERTVAAAEEDKVSRIHSEVAKRQKDCEQDLAGAEPALVAAQEALNTLNKSNLTELRSFGSPPVAVRNVTSAVMVLLATDGKIPKDLSWRAAKLTMSKVDNFLDSLINFDKNHIHENSIRAIQTYLRSPEFKPEVVLAKSQAAAGLCSWVINVLKYYEVYCNVEPKRRALAEANAEYQVAKEKLARIQEKVTEVELRLNELQSRCDAATEAKLRCESEAQRTAFSLHLANRLLGGLASERKRWSTLATRFRELERSLAGDMLLASAFVAYLGPFTGTYRHQLQFEYWRPFLETKSNLELGSGSDDSSTLGPMVSLLLEDETIVGRWRNDGLPGDMASVENAAIFDACFLIWRWPLIVDPQVQAMSWIRAMYKEKVLIVRTDQKGYLDQIEEALVTGQIVVVENLEENIDPRLYPVVFQNFVKKGKAIKLGNKEIPFNPDFRLILHTKLSNPRYGPEIQAQTTIINFGVTLEGLADQLLAEVVSKERPDLEDAKASLTKQQSEFAITLKQLEESLLSRLSEAEGDLVGDVILVESLEQTKATAAEVQARDEEARTTEAKIDQARSVYRDVADRTALVYFVVQDMVTLSPMYLFSLKAIKEVFHKAIDRCEPTPDVETRVKKLVEVITLSIFNYVSRGLFENHKTVLAAHLTFQILRLRENIPVDVTEFLLHQNLEESNLESPVEFMSAQAWSAIRVLSSLDEFQGLDRDMEASPKRWKKFLDSSFPEKEALPQEWKNKSTPFHKLCILRCLRSDRVMYAIRDFVSEVLGSEFVGCRPIDLDNVLNEWGSCRTPLLFILSAGVDPLHDLEACGTAPTTIQNISLGQGQETIAEQTMQEAMNAGQWVVLQNIHLAKGWLHNLERKLENLQSGTVHESFRLFLSANPPEEGSKPIPPGVLEACLKVTNEPPKGMKANLHKALDNFSQETFDSSSRDTEFKSLLFTLCYFHAVLTERKKFGAQGWNYPYPFNDSDLLISANVLHNHLDNDGSRGSNIPWDDLRFLFGEIMYGGHITDDRDRKICTAYLNRFFNNEQLEADYPLCPGFGMPPILSYVGYHRYIDEHLPSESPVLYGLHPNAEVGCLTDASNSLLRALHLLEPSTATDPAHDIPLNNKPNECAVIAASNEEKIRQVAEDITDKLPSQFPLTDLHGRVTDEGNISPFAAVGLQECERMNSLLHEINQSLQDIDRGLKGELPWSEEMESLGESLASDAVPRIWTRKAYPSLLPLGSWFTDLMQRYRALNQWVHAELSTLPPAVWLGGLFSPQSFLTAVIQTSGRKHDQPLDKLALHCEVTKKNPEDCSMPPREGANIAGLYMEGGRWDFSTSSIMDPLMKELHPPMPVISLRAVLADKVDIRSAYPCPVYRTRQRGDTFVWEFPLKSSVPPDKWIIAGTALLLQI